MISNLHCQKIEFRGLALLLFRVEIFEIKERAPRQTPPVLGRVQRLGGLIG
jgi:hypothetical protein